MSDRPKKDYAFGICLGSLPPIVTCSSSEFAWLALERMMGQSRSALKTSGYELVWLCIERLPIPADMTRVSR